MMHPFMSMMTLIAHLDLRLELITQAILRKRKITRMILLIDRAQVGLKLKAIMKLQMIFK